MKPTEGDFAYLKRPGEDVKEGEVVASGEEYEIRLFESNEVVTASVDDVWTTDDSLRVTV